jgi:hypothetical protein
MGRTNRIELIRKIEKHRGSRLLCCLTSDRQNAMGMIAKDFIPVFFGQLGGFQGHKKVDVFIFTQGGDSLAAFGLSRLVREFAPWYGALVPHWCHSAGTLFVLGANEISMARGATLTPLDPSVQGPLNPVVELNSGQRQSLPVSVESLAGYRSLIQKDWHLNKDGAAVAFRVLADKMNPLALGDVYRSRQQIRKLARTLLRCHRTDKKQIRKLVKQLTGGLGSHEYLISRREARRLLGSQIGEDDAGLEKLVWELYLDFRDEMNLGEIFDGGMVANAWTAAGKALPALDEQKVAVVESATAGDEFARTVQVAALPVMTPAGPTLAFQAAVVRAGWKHYD